MSIAIQRNEWIKPFEKATNPWNQTFRGKGVIVTALKIVKAALMTIPFILQSSLLLLANSAICIANKVHSCFARRKVEPLTRPAVAALPTPSSRGLEIDGVVKIERFTDGQTGFPALGLSFHTAKQADNFYQLFGADFYLALHPENGNALGNIEPAREDSKKMLFFGYGENHTNLLESLKMVINNKRANPL